MSNTVIYCETREDWHQLFDLHNEAQWRLGVTDVRGPTVANFWKAATLGGPRLGVFGRDGFTRVEGPIDKATHDLWTDLTAD
jgi:hypothetical protein